MYATPCDLLFLPIGLSAMPPTTCTGGWPAVVEVPEGVVSAVVDAGEELLELFLSLEKTPAIASTAMTMPARSARPAIAPRIRRRLSADSASGESASRSRFC